MSMDIEQVLLAQAMRNAESYPSKEAAEYGGAALGALGGLAVGSVPHQIGRGVNAVTGRQPNRFKPGTRLAGGLVGAILGGQLGKGIRNEMLNNSPEAQILAKMQAGTFTASDAYQLEGLLANTYSKMGIV